jgi:diadenosine tetraphosphate (Ap4A) HIT family hydrolase
MRQLLNALLLITVGIALGGYMFRDVQPRSFLALPNCRDSCYRPSDLAGLLASAAIQRVPAALPLVLRETDRCITIQHPFPSFKNHFVVFPKRDIKDIASIAVEDAPVLMECFEHMRWLVARHNLSRYRVETNGAGLQHVTYLHFHLVSNEGSP